jgi:hypothetical protein
MMRGSEACGVLRALEVMQSAPLGCILQAVTSGDTEPHLHCGEFAIIDTTDREPIIGELYIIERSAAIQDPKIAHEGAFKKISAAGTHAARSR